MPGFILHGIGCQPSQDFAKEITHCAETVTNEDMKKYFFESIEKKYDEENPGIDILHCCGKFVIFDVNFIL